MTSFGLQITKIVFGSKAATDMCEITVARAKLMFSERQKGMLIKESFLSRSLFGNIVILVYFLYYVQTK